MQPGDTITPSNQSDQTAQPAPASLPPVQDVSQQPNSQPAPSKQAAPAALPQPPQQTYDQSPETNQNEDSFDDSPWNEDQPQNVNITSQAEWTASEFMDHDKAADWYMALGLGAVILSGVLYFATRDFISIFVVVVATVLFGISGSRRPQTRSYQVTNVGLQVDQKMYPYSDIKSFSVIDEGSIHSIQLLPLKRYMPAMTIYYPPDQEEEIFNALANYLPYEERKHDSVDKLMKRLRF